jgi:hypothetical protein
MNANKSKKPVIFQKARKMGICTEFHGQNCILCKTILSPICISLGKTTQKVKLMLFGHFYCGYAPSSDRIFVSNNKQLNSGGRPL